MATIDCPWCDEPATVDARELDELACGTCGVTVAIAPDPESARIELAA